MVAGVGRIALHQVNEARPIAHSIAGSVIDLNEELKLESPSMRKLLRLGKSLSADANKLQMALSDYLAQAELERKKQEADRKRLEDVARKKNGAGADAAAAAAPPPNMDIPWAVHMDYIVCLEDGQKVLDLAAHLELLGMTPSGYRQKWGLPDAYPMQAPDLTFEDGPIFECDLECGDFRRIHMDEKFYPHWLKAYY